jgi:hypothetical protein
MYTKTKVHDNKYLINDTYNDYIAISLGDNWVLCEPSGMRVDNKIHATIDLLIHYYENLTAEDHDKQQ